MVEHVVHRTLHMVRSRQSEGHDEAHVTQVFIHARDLDQPAGELVSPHDVAMQLVHFDVLDVSLSPFVLDVCCCTTTVVAPAPTTAPMIAPTM